MMMWVFAVLIVLAMGVIAMLAAGKGEPMSIAYDDRPDSVVAADRPLAAADLRRVRFPLAVRGYRMGEVDALLARLAAQLETTTDAGGPADGPVLGDAADDTIGPVDAVPSSLEDR